MTPCKYGPTSMHNVRRIIDMIGSHAGLDDQDVLREINAIAIDTEALMTEKDPVRKSMALVVVLMQQSTVPRLVKRAGEQVTIYHVTNPAMWQLAADEAHKLNGKVIV